MSALTGRRRAGLLIPLFSCPSTASWGIGDIGDVGPVTEWLASAGQRVFQLLPLNEMAPRQQSPYSAISAMAIDPIFIRVPGVPEFEALGGEAALSPGDREALADVRSAKRIDHRTVRRLKYTALRAGFERFLEAEWRRDTARARALRSYASEQAWWVEDYSLFRALHVREHERPWTEWPVELQRREPAAIDRARRELADEVVFHQYLQWLAGTQWQHAREHTHGVALFGDLPFMVDGDSADVWARQQQFRLDVSVGAPPDAFSATGQDWGMPLYRWDVMALEDYRWLRERARRSADLFHGYRVDHLVGFYRTYGRLKNGGEGFFTPPDAFSATGQDWGMPLYRWDVMGLEDFRWLRERARRSADLFHGYRVDHLVGFYRTYGRLKGGDGFFSPPDEPSQLALGERLLELIRGAGAEIIAEDLGTVPDFVRASLAHLGIPGYRVFRWERHWHTPGQPFRDPSEYPSLSVAASGTHDTEPLASWWEHAKDDERRKVSELPLIRLIARGHDLLDAPYHTVVRDVLLEAMFASGSDLLLLPVQDAFGWKDRINEPATVSEENWTYRLPWPVDTLDRVPEACERRDQLRAWSERYARHG